MLTLLQCHSTPVLLLWHVKDPSFSAKNAGGRLYPNTLTPSTKRGRGGLTMLLTYSAGIYHGNELTRNSSGNARPQSSQLAEPLLTDLGLVSGNGVRELISIEKKRKQKKKKKRKLGLILQIFFSPNPRMRGKSQHHYYQRNVERAQRNRAARKQNKTKLLKGIGVLTNGN